MSFLVICTVYQAQPFGSSHPETGDNLVSLANPSKLPLLPIPLSCHPDPQEPHRACAICTYGILRHELPALRVPIAVASSGGIYDQ